MRKMARSERVRGARKGIGEIRGFGTHLRLSGQNSTGVGNCIETSIDGLERSHPLIAFKKSVVWLGVIVLASRTHFKCGYPAEAIRKEAARDPQESLDDSGTVL